MSTSTIFSPAHILDAQISPRAREVLMLLASQTSAQEPTLCAAIDSFSCGNTQRQSHRVLRGDRGKTTPGE